MDYAKLDGVVNVRQKMVNCGFEDFVVDRECGERVEYLDGV